LNPKLNEFGSKSTRKEETVRTATSGKRTEAFQNGRWQDQKQLVDQRPLGTHDCDQEGVRF